MLEKRVEGAVGVSQEAVWGSSFSAEEAAGAEALRRSSRQPVQLWQRASWQSGRRGHLG